MVDFSFIVSLYVSDLPNVTISIIFYSSTRTVYCVLVRYPSRTGTILSGDNSTVRGRGQFISRTRRRARRSRNEERPSRVGKIQSSLVSHGTRASNYSHLEDDIPQTNVSNLKQSAST